MRETLYVKYNRTRSRRYQTKVQIEMDNGVMIVRKSPLVDDARAHVDGIVDKYNRYNGIYKNVKFVETYAENECSCCKYLNGESVGQYLGNFVNDVDALIEKVNKYADVVTALKDEYLTEFVVTEAFVDIFGEIDGIYGYNAQAAAISNIDSIFENYIINDGVIYAIDFEWMLEVIVPVAFIKYRAVKMFYIAYGSVLSGKINIEEFLERCGFPKCDTEMFEEMDERFQQYVHDKDRRSIYTNRYSKKITTFDELLMKANIEHILELKDQHIRNIEEAKQSLEDDVTEQGRIIDMQAKTINDQREIISNLNLAIDDMRESLSVLRREIRNPFYALYRLTRKLAYKVLPYNVTRGLQILRNEGLYAFIYKVRMRREDDNRYEKWITALEANRKAVEKVIDFEYRPLISVLVPVYNVSEKMLTECIESVINQSYTNWQLCLADDCSTLPEVRQVLSRYENRLNIDIIYRDRNGHISAATNTAMEAAKGEFISFLDCDDVLADNALYEMVKALNEQPELDFLYSDEDKITENGKHRQEPHFKPDWSPDTIMSIMYTCHFALYRRSIAEEIGGLRLGYEGSQDYDFVLRYTEKIPYSHIKHIDRILYHWRTRKESTATDAGAKPYVLEAASKAKADAVERRGYKADIELIKNVWQYRVNYIPQGNARVSIIIPSKDNPEILEQCVSSIAENTRYQYYDIFVIDNGSNETNKAKYEKLCAEYGCTYHYEVMEFNFSRMCNTGALNTDGEYILFLNDDIKIIGEEWLERMLGQAQVSYTGAVGAKLLYPDSKLIQHDGVINIKNGPTHAFEGYDDSEIYYIGRNFLDYNYIAVTAACLLISREKFNEINGFNEELRVAYNDVDLCFRLVEAGYYNVIRNDVVLYHYESYSRGYDMVDKEKMKRLIHERENLYSMHPVFAESDHMDPFYNRNLAQGRNDFSNNYEGSVMKNSRCILKKADDYRVSDKIRCNIDSISLENGINIMGWAIKTGSRRNNVRKPHLLIVYEDGVVAVFETGKVYRPDIGENIGHKRIAMAGFSVMSDYVPDDRGVSFRVAIAFGKDMVYVD